MGQTTALRESAYLRGDVAQLGEHHVRNVGAEGSNPIISTRINKADLVSAFFADFRHDAIALRYLMAFVQISDLMDRRFFAM